MPFSNIIGHQETIRLLKTAEQSRRMAAAYLFLGPNHIGKKATAMAFAQYLNCPQRKEDACGICPTCRQIEAGSYPGYKEVNPDGKNIKIKQIQEVRQWLGFRQSGSIMRVLVLDQAERMNAESSNAFLKTLEEPPSDTLIILVTEQSSQLLETIVSRCQPVRFRRLLEAELAEVLKHHTELTETQAAWVAPFCQGQLKPAWVQATEEIAAVYRAVINWLRKAENASHTEIAQRVEEWSGSSKIEWQLMLEMMELWFRDLLIFFHSQQSEALIYRQETQILEWYLETYHVDAFLQSFESIQSARHRIALNAMPSLALLGVWLEVFRSLKAHRQV